jgi:hypothetical protein
VLPGSYAAHPGPPRRYLHNVIVSAHKLAILLTLLGAPALLGGLAPAASGGTAAHATALTQSPELWATVDLCNTPHHPDEIGIRGSMPSDGHPHDIMYMRFLVQSLDTTTHQWADIGGSADSGFERIGLATITRQSGHNFGFTPSTTAYTMRGLVEFQWRRAGHVVHLAARPTSAHRTSLAGAEPKGFSAATCTLS